MDDNERVQALAYEIWESDGRPAGEHLSHWQQALVELGLADPVGQGADDQHVTVEEPANEWPAADTRE